MIRQPNAILGNSQILVSIGGNGELLSFFYPRIDYAQNVEESIAGIFSGDRMMWMDSEEWRSRQVYTRDTNILQTSLEHPIGINIEVEDIVLSSRAVLVRKYGITSVRKFSGKFCFYANFAPGEHREKNSAYIDPSGLIVQYWQDINLGLVSEPEFQEWQIGRDPDRAMPASKPDSRIKQSREDIGCVNVNTAWELELDPGVLKEIILILAASHNRFKLVQEIQAVRKTPYIELRSNTIDFWQQKLSNAKEIKPLEYQEAYKRSLLALMLLRDQQYGSFIAAPEFDPYYEKSGGYGYCWNRDAVSMALALGMSGYVEAGNAFAGWCRKAQLEDGSWFQRYWINGDLAPGWSNFDYSTQLDQIGATLHFYLEHSRNLRSNRSEYFEAIFESVKRGAGYIMKRTASGLSDSCADLWEAHYGSFTYTNAALYRGLLSSAQIALAIGETDLTEDWSSRANLLKQEVIDKLRVREGYFARGIVDEELDSTYDASFLGILEPFELIDLRDDKERFMIESSITLMDKKLGVYVNDGIGIKRFEGDDYIGGNPWTLTTLWYALVLLRLANYYRDLDQNKAERYRQRAVDCINWCLRGSTSTGLLPEQVDRFTGKPAWAVPLGWAHALMVKCLNLI